jgi:ketosteroid isomerase-like protein
MKEEGVANSQLETKNLVTAFLERLSAADADGLSELFAEDIDWFVPGGKDLPWTGHRYKRTDIPVYFHTMWPRFVPGQSESIPEKILIAGADAVFFARFAHTSADTGRRFETEVAMHFTIQSEKIVRMYLYEDTLAVRDAFFPK